MLRSLKDRRILLAPFFLAVNSFYFWAIFGGIGIRFCCDSSGHLYAGALFFKDGLLFENPYPGYRSYFSYAAAEVVRLLGSGFVSARSTWFESPEYTVGSLICFAVGGLSVIAWLGRRRGFLPIFSAVYLLPFSMAYVPYPLQEAQLAIVLGPLLVILVVLLDERRFGVAVPLLLVFAALALMIRNSFLLVAVPIVALAAYWSLAQKRLAAFAIGVLLAVVIIAPQSYAMLKTRGTAYPYPRNGPLFMHFVLGHQAWRYETHIVDERAVRGLKPTEFPPISTPGQLLERTFSAPLEVLALMLGHAIGAFDYSQFKVYITEPRKAQFSGLNVAVGFGLFLGLVQWIRRMLHGSYSASDVFLDACMIGSFALLPLVVVETRYSYFATVALFCRAFELPREWDWRFRPTLILAAAALAFGVAMAILIGLMNGPIAAEPGAIG